MRSNTDSHSRDEVEATANQTTLPNHVYTESIPRHLPKGTAQHELRQRLAMTSTLPEVIALLTDYDAELMRMKEDYYAYREMTERRLLDQDNKINMNYAFIQKFVAEMSSKQLLTNGNEAGNSQALGVTPSESEIVTDQIMSRKRKRCQAIHDHCSHSSFLEQSHNMYPESPLVPVSRLLNPQALHHNSVIPGSLNSQQATRRVGMKPNFSVPAFPTIAFDAELEENDDDLLAGRTSVPRAVEDDLEPEEVKPSTTQVVVTRGPSKRDSNHSPAHAAAIQAVRDRLIAGKAALASRRFSTTPPHGISANAAAQRVSVTSSPKDPTPTLGTASPTTSALRATGIQEQSPVGEAVLPTTQEPDQVVPASANHSTITPDRFRAIKMQKHSTIPTTDVLETDHGIMR